MLGPHNVPLVTDPDLASADIPLATLSAITHAEDAGVDAIPRALAEALHGLGDEEDLHVFAELTELGLANTAAADTWSKLMSVDLSFYRSKTSQRLRAEGRAEGRLEDVIDKILRLLHTRGIAVPAAAEERIRSCADLDVLDRWFDRAITASNIAEVFADRGRNRRAEQRTSRYPAESARAAGATAEAGPGCGGRRRSGATAASAPSAQNSQSSSSVLTALPMT